MPLSGNKGEWSEIYTLFKLLADQKLFIGDENQQRIEDLYYPIVQILRYEKENEISYTIKKDIIIQTNNGEKFSIDVLQFREKAVELLGLIQKNNNTFALPTIEAFMNEVKCTKLKADSSDKADIKIVIHDQRTQTDHLLGYSIKSYLGGTPTMINSSKSTNFKYKVVGLNPALVNEINSISSKSKIQDRIENIYKNNGKLIFDKVVSSTFSNNLKLVDSLLPNIVAEMLLCKFHKGKSHISDICTELNKNNPCNYDLIGNPHFYEYKIKRLLLEAALGMVPNTAWDGNYDANGGYIVVKEDGEIICYHIYDKSLFENYLFHKTKLDTPSSSRHEFGIIEIENEELIFKLNLQVRFI